MVASEVVILLGVGQKSLYELVGLTTDVVWVNWESHLFLLVVRKGNKNDTLGRSP